MRRDTLRTQRTTTGDYHAESRGSRRIGWIADDAGAVDMATGATGLMIGNQTRSAGASGVSGLIRSLDYAPGWRGVIALFYGIWETLAGGWATQPSAQFKFHKFLTSTCST